MVVYTGTFFLDIISKLKKERVKSYSNCSSLKKKLTHWVIKQHQKTIFKQLALYSVANRRALMYRADNAFLIM
jgi:hypothetical protein